MLNSSSRVSTSSQETSSGSDGRAPLSDKTAIPRDEDIRAAIVLFTICKRIGCLYFMLASRYIPHMALLKGNLVLKPSVPHTLPNIETLCILMYDMTFIE